MTTEKVCICSRINFSEGSYQNIGNRHFFLVGGGGGGGGGLFREKNRV